MYQRLQLQLSEGIAVVQLNRSEKANALDHVFFEEIQHVFDELSQNTACRVVVLAAQGKHFCSGIDLELLASVHQKIKHASAAHQNEQLRKLVLQLQAPFNAIANCSKPVLAAVHGACVGAGVDMIAACDMRYASQNSVFSIKEIQVGMVADLGTLQRLPKLVGMGLVKEWAFTGKNIDANEAKNTHLLNAVFENEVQLMENVLEIARQIAKNSPISVRGTKEMLNFMQDHSVQDGLNYVAVWNAAMLLSADLQESMQASFERRSPSFLD